MSVVPQGVTVYNTIVLKYLRFFMLPPKLDQSYVSKLDVLLHQLDKTIPLSVSQQEEIEKHQRIMRLRDDATASDKIDII